MTSPIGIIYQVRRGTSTQIATFTPALGEVVGDMTYLRETVGDGAQVGGFPIGKTQVKTLIDASSYTVLASDVLVFYAVMSTGVTSHAITLPLASAYPSGQDLRIQDASGNGGGSSVPFTITGATVANATGGFDTINTSTATLTFNSQVGQGRTLISNGSSGWYCYSS